MAIGEAIVLLIKEDFNLLLTELFQLNCKNKLTQSVQGNEILLMKLILREIASGDIVSSHMSKEKAEKTLDVVKCLYGEKILDFNNLDEEKEFFKVYDGLYSSNGLKRKISLDVESD